jgi:hemerythrin
LADQRSMDTRSAPRLVIWSDYYNVGIGRIDAQHRGLVDLLNELNAAVAAGREHSELERILAGLAAAAVSHFATEEGLLTKFAYPSYDQHKAEHGRLMAQVRLLQEKVRKKETSGTPELVAFGERWLIGHIVYLDKKYTAHLHAAGVL